MATFDQVKTVRLRIHDPLGFINLVETDELPATPANQTAYTITDSGVYQEYRSEVWTDVPLEISDEQIKLLIDLYGVDGAAIQAIKNIMMSLGQKLGLESHSSGTETVKYQSLSSLYNFYKNMLASMKEDIAVSEGVSTGRIFNTTRPIIGGVEEL
ncbi:MAG TPA: hypothetical protein PLN48_14910 [Lachnospiraceae bacterium]|nr:hypothetical protein [Spirochaetia bacterium]HUM85034.1 hypothetical protein [Lachnospiraceae bacterium]